jgi:hypothetical protein
LISEKTYTSSHTLNRKTLVIQSRLHLFDYVFVRRIGNGSFGSGQ